MLAPSRPPRAAAMIFAGAPISGAPSSVSAPLLAHAAASARRRRGHEMPASFEFRHTQAVDFLAFRSPGAQDGCMRTSGATCHDIIITASFRYELASCRSTIISPHHRGRNMPTTHENIYEMPPPADAGHAAAYFCAASRCRHTGMIRQRRLPPRLSSQPAGCLQERSGHDARRMICRWRAIQLFLGSLLPPARVNSILLSCIDATHEILISFMIRYIHAAKKRAPGYGGAMRSRAAQA